MVGGRWAIARGLISITPLSLDLTHQATREALGPLLATSASGRMKDAGCDAVVMVDDWGRSTGAKGEREEALRRGLPVFMQADLYGVDVTAFDAWLAGRKERP